MIYEEPAFKPGGDRYMLIQFGNELNLALNFTAHSPGDAIAQVGIKGGDRKHALLRLAVAPSRARPDQLLRPRDMRCRFLYP